MDDSEFHIPSHTGLSSQAGQLFTLRQIKEEDEQAFNDSISYLDQNMHSELKDQSDQESSSSSDGSESGSPYYILNPEDNEQKDSNEGDCNNDEFSFIKEYNAAQAETNSSLKDNKTLNNEDALFDPNLEYLCWDFHPNETEPPSTFTYSTYLESLRTTVNTIMKKPIKAPFSLNSRKTIIQVNKGD